MINSKIILLATAIAVTGLGACSAPVAAPTPANIASQVSVADAMASGTFEGRSDHITTGVASIVGTPGSYSLILSADFELDGAPDPIIGFGNSGAFDIATKVGPLSNRTGGQAYTLPASFDPAANSEVYVWCEKFGVPLGVAALH